MKASNIEGILAAKPKVVLLGELLARVTALGRTTWLDLPSSPGIYVVSSPVWEHRPLTAAAGRARHAIPVDPVVLSEKRNRILSGGPTDILYIGKAGGRSSDLRKRVRQFVRFGKGQARNHRGGEWLWQVEGVHNAELWMWTCPRGEPELLERRLLEAFSADHGELPLANRI